METAVVMTEKLIFQPAGTRDQGRDLMANAIDSYVSEVVEARPYDLADRIIRTLNQRGWWFVWGADV